MIQNKLYHPLFFFNIIILNNYEKIKTKLTETDCLVYLYLIKSMDCLIIYNEIYYQYLYSQDGYDIVYQPIL